MTHPQIEKSKTALLLVNLGTPDAPTKTAVRRYLKEFLSDPRVIELQNSLLGKIFWQAVLRGIILNTRPAKSAAAYAKVWNKETDESPLRYHTRRQAEALARHLPNIKTIWAMRYGNPSIADTLGELREQGCDKIFVLALYPQYSATTSASVYDEVFRVLKNMRWQPAVRTCPAWHDDPLYIQALQVSVRRHLQNLDWQPDLILTSYHGLPQKYFDAGDPYHCHCAKTTRLLREALGKSEDEIKLTFQSRFGVQKWLTPYTDKTAIAAAQNGVRKIAVITPSFVADCLETLEEIDIALRDEFLAAGGTHFTTIPCLNDSPESIAALAAIAARETLGWA